MLHQQGFARIVNFTTEARMDLTLDDILRSAHKLQSDTRSPVLILLHQPLDGSAPAEYREGYSWKLIVTPEQVTRFRNATELWANFGPARTDESFTAFVVK